MNRVWARLAVVGATATTTSLAPSARGQQAPLAEVEGSMGAMLLLGGNMFTTPDNRPLEASGNESEGLGFSGDAGGFGWGIGPYVEARMAESLGIHFGVLYDQSILQRDVDFTRLTSPRSQTVVLNESIVMRSIRLPLLVKGILPLSFGRAWAGLGPEVIVTKWVEAEKDPPDEVEGELRARESSSVLLAFGLGCAIDLGDTLELPIELRGARNLSQKADWSGRVRVEGNGDPTYNLSTVRAQSTWDFRLGLGLGYRFE